MAWELATYDGGLLASDIDVEDATVDVVRPGDPVRVTHVLDAVEPRIRPDGRAAFPREGRAGEGRTNSLGGVVILSCLDFAAAERPLHEQESLVDIDGPGAAYTPFADETCIVLTFAASGENEEAERQARAKTLEAAEMLAAATLDAE